MTNVGLALLVVSAVAFVVMVTSMRMAIRRRMQSTLRVFRLTFPRSLKAEEVESFLDGLSGLLLPWWRRWLTSPFVVIETAADVNGIENYLMVPEAWQRSVLGLLSVNLPGVRFTPCDMPSRNLTIGAEYRLTNNQREVGGDAAATSARLLASLHPLGKREAVVVQWIITPHAPVAPARMATTDERHYLSTPPGVTNTSEAATALRSKQSKPLLLAVGRIAVSANDRGRQRALLRQTEVAWHSVRSPGVHLERRWMGEQTAARRTGERTAPLIEWPGAYNTSELARLIGFPIDAVSIPGLILGGCRPLAPSPAIPTTGTVVGDSNFPGSARPLALDLQGRLRHVHLLGPTGYGKSTLMVQIIVQDLEAGYGCVVLDPKGDLVQSVLERIPARRLADVVVLDPADTERPVGLNPLQSIDRDHQEVVVENLVGLFKSLYRNSWGPRLDDILRAALLTLAGAKGATLCEVPLILTDPTYRRRLVGRLDDPVGLESFWGWYEALSDAERAMAVGPVLNKVRAFTMRPRVRSIIGQSNPTLNLRDVLANRKVLLVSLATGLLGEEAAALLGALVVAELWHATLARAGHHADARRPVMAFLDEWQHFVHLPIPMSSVLAEARGLGLGLTLAHQHISQLPEETRGAVLADTRSRVVFQLPAADARLMAREMGGVLTPEDLMGLGQYEVAAQLFAGGSTQIPVTATTRAIGPESSDSAVVRERSRQRFGVDRAEVETAIRKRQQSGPPRSVGRRDRRQVRNGGQP
jgi:Type IV secretory system Conjugative DNA transfer